MGRIANNYIYNVLYQILVIIAPLITAPYLSRTLGADAWGQYGYVYTVASIIGTIGLLGLYNYGTRQIAYFHYSEVETNYIFWELILLRVILLIPGILIYIIIGIISKSIILFLVYIPWILASYIDVSWLYVGKEDMKPAVLKNAFAKLLSILGIFVFVHQPEDVWKYLAIISVSTFMANISVWFSIKKYVNKPKMRKKQLDSHLKGALLLFLPQVASMIYLQVDKVMLKWFSGNSQIAFYDQAEKIISIPLAFITVLSTVMMPRIASEFADKNIQNVQKLLRRAIDISAIIAFPMMFGIAGIAKQFIPWYLGDDFNPVVIAMYLICPIILFNSLSGILGSQYLTATNQTKIMTKAYVIAALANIIVNSILIPFWGFMGAAIATQFSSLLSVLIQYRYVSKQIEIRIICKDNLLYALLGLLVFVLTYLLGNVLSSSPITTFVQIVLGSIFYLGILILLKNNTLLDILRAILGIFRGKTNESK